MLMSEELVDNHNNTMRGMFENFSSMIRTYIAIT